MRVNEVLEEIARRHPNELRRPRSWEGGSSVIPMGRLESHRFSAQYLFLARVTYRRPVAREVEVRYPSEDHPRVANARYYKAYQHAWRVYSYDYVTDALRRVGEWAQKETARQWLIYAMHSPDWSLIPPTRQLMPDY